MSTNDYELIRLAVDGNTNARDILHSKYALKVYAWSLTILKEKESAEDATQTVFIKLWSGKLSNYDSSQGEISSYLHGITRNTCIDIIRANKKYVGLERVSNNASAEDINSNLLNKERRLIVMSCINQLDKIDRQIILDRYHNGLKLDEIAQNLFMSVDNVKIRLFRARGKLEKLILEFGSILIIFIMYQKFF